MIGISIDLSELLNIPDDINNNLEDTMDSLSYDFEQSLIEKAEGLLNSSKNDYIDAIYREYDGNGTWTVGIKDSWLAASIEEGSDAVDLKAISRSKIKTSKDGGWYADIPFRHKTSRASNEMAGFASKMPSSVYKAALSSAKAGNRLAAANAPKTTVTPYKTTYPSAQVYGGIFRTKMAGRTAWFTIRRISSKSPASSWIHPGFSARNIIPMTLESFNIEGKLQDIIAE